MLSGCTILHTGFLVDLDSRLVGTDPNDFTNKIVMSDFDLRAGWVSKLRRTKKSGFRTKGYHTSSYMATPIMSSATMTGLGKHCQLRSSGVRSSKVIFFLFQARGGSSAAEGDR